jgi:3-oxoacyl-[acyl-carrier protein] reductase
MDIALTGKVAVVTGAGGGIGAAIASAFGELGAATVVHYHRNHDGAAAVARRIEAAGARVSLVQSNLATPGGMDSVIGAAAELGEHIDVLVNNAGDLLQRSPVETSPDELYDATLDLNLRSVFVACRAVLPTMVAQRGGSIINVTSIAARNGGGPGSVIYAAAKAAVSTLTRGLAKEVAGLGIRVNAISPGVIDTAFHERNSTSDQVAGMVAGIPMARMGRADECVGAAVFLAVPQMSSYVTGQVIEINGGQYMP